MSRISRMKLRWFAVLKERLWCDWICAAVHYALLLMHICYMHIFPLMLYVFQTGETYKNKNVWQIRQNFTNYTLHTNLLPICKIVKVECMLPNFSGAKRHRPITCVCHFDPLLERFIYGAFWFFLSYHMYHSVKQLMAYTTNALFTFYAKMMQCRLKYLLEHVLLFL